MARPSSRRPQNVPGALFVDGTCIDCDACRWIAPATFDRRGEMSRVRAQEALVACPTALDRA